MTYYNCRARKFICGMEEWLTQQLATFDLNSPDIIDYLVPIVEDEDETIGDIVESCQEFLEASMVGKQKIWHLS